MSKSDLNTEIRSFVEKLLIDIQSPNFQDDRTHNFGLNLLCSYLEVSLKNIYLAHGEDIEIPGFPIPSQSIPENPKQKNNISEGKYKEEFEKIQALENNTEIIDQLTELASEMEVLREELEKSKRSPGKIY
jgi:hypothetical protein